MEQAALWATVIGLPVAIIGLIISLISLRMQKKDIDTTKKELDSLKDVINIHTKIISSQDTKTITNIQINSSDMDVTRVAALFAQMPNGGK